MNQSQLTNLILEQSKDLFWMVNLDFELIYANKSYLDLMKEMTGEEKQLNETVIAEGFGAGYIKKWTSYYKRAFAGERFEIEEHFFNKKTDDIQYGQTTFDPIKGEDNKIFAVACQSKDITKIVNQRAEANQMMDASLDVFCSINEEGNFVYVSAAAEDHWGYMPEELIGKAYIDLILEEDVPKTNEAAAAILSGQDTKSFVNRYHKKDGGIAYNLWSVRWDEDSKLLYCVAKDGKESIEQEEKIRQSELRFKSLVQEGSDLIGILDEAGSYMYVSPTSISVLGIKPEEFIGRSPFEFIHPDDAKKVLDSLQKIATENKVLVTPFRFQNHKKEWRWIETVLTNMLDNPSVRGIVANSRDITDIIEQKEKIQQSEQRFKSLVQEGADLITILDLEGNYKFVSPTSQVVLGIEPHDYIGKNAFEFIHPDDKEKTVAGLQKIKTEKKVVLEPYRFLNYQKEWRWIDTVLTNRLENPAINGVVSNSRDITDKIEEKQRLKLFESVITYTNDAVLITEAEPFDEPGPKIIYVNEAFSKMTGYSAEEVIGKTPRLLHGPNSNKKELAKLGKALRNWETHEITTINYKKNGEEFWVNFTVTPVANEKGWYTHWISIERDVTQQKIKELKNELLTQINANFNSENELLSALNELCKSISKYGKFDIVEVWTTNLEKNQMQLFSHYVANTEDEIFYDDTSTVTTIEIALGIAGKVWAEGEQLLWDDVENHKDFIRKNAAKKVGLKAVMGIPLRFKEEIIGVLNIGTKHSADYLKKYAQLFKQLELVIGSELNRKKLENDLSHLFDAIPDILCLLDFEGRFLKINKAGHELLGHSEAEILYHSFDEFMHPDDKKIDFKKLLRSEQGENTSKFENRFLTKDGEIVWLNWLCNSSFKDSTIYATAKNITEEKKLRELNRQTRQLAKVGGWEYSLIENHLFWSKEVHHLHETNANTFIPDVDSAIGFYKEEYKAFVTDEINKSLSEGIYLDYEAVIITVTKKERWIRVIGSPENIDGKCVKFVGSFQDITDKKLADIELQENLKSLEDYKFSLDQSSIIAFTDCKGVITSVNDNFCKISKYNREELIGKTHQLINSKHHPAAFFNDLWKTISSGEVWRGEIKNKAKDGSYYWVYTTIVPFLDEKNKPFQYLAIRFDITSRKNSEEKLVDSEQKYRQLALQLQLQQVHLTNAQKVAKIGSWETDLSDLKLTWSDETYRIFGTDRESFEPSHEKFLEYVHPLDREKVDNAFVESIQLPNDTQNKIEHRIITPSGDIKYVEERWKITHDDKGVPILVIGICQDITERKMTEEKLVDSEQKYRQLALELQLQQVHLTNAQEVAKIGSWETDLSDFKSTWSDEIYRIFEIERDGFELTYEEFLKNVYPLDRDKVDKAFLESIQATTESQNVIEHRIVTSSGQIKEIEERWKITYNDHSEPLLAIGSFQDITERKKAEKAIIDSEEKRRLIMSGALDAIICIDIKENITFWNPQAEVIFGWKEAEVMGQPLSELIVPEPFRKYHNDGIKRYLKTGEGKALNILLELSAIKKSGEEFPIELTVIPIKQGEDVFFCAFIRDITERKKAEKELQNAFEERNSIFESISDNFYALDNDFNFTYINNSCAALLGIDPVTTLGKNIFQEFPDLLKSNFEKELLQVQKTAKATKFEFYYTPYDSWFDENIYPTPNGFSIYFLDITQRKKAEQEKNSLQSTLENSLNEIYIFDADTFQFNYVNKGALLNLGYSEKEIKTLTPIDIKPEFTTTSFKEMIIPLVNNEKEKIIFFTNNQRKDGSLYPVEVHLQFVTESNNKRFLAIILDITERKKATEIILQSNERFEKVTEATNDVIWDWDLINQTYYRSKAIERFFGNNTSKSFTNNDFWDDNFHPEDIAKIKNSVKEAITNPSTTRWEQEYRVFNENGETLYVIDRGVIIRNEKGTAIRMVGAMTDISEQKHMTVQLSELNQSLQQHTLELERSNEELEQFAFVASHDLQEPLRMISSFMDLLQRKYGNLLDEKGHQYIHFATDGAKRMKQIILDLLDYSRASKPIEVYEEVAINEVISEFEQLRRKLILEKNATITAKDLPILITCRAPITQIFHCLLDNALKYAKDGISPVININVEEHETQWQFSIRDNGIGIDAQFYNKIFVIFQRLHNKDKYAGTGIGLSIAKRHVEFLGGKIWLESSPEEGTIFYFTIDKINKHE